jgi:PAS domain S-box-containing protein
LALGGYFFYNAGLITTGVLQLAIAIILTALLFGSKAQWVTVICGELLYLSLGWLAGERDFEVFFTSGLVVGFSLSGIALLQWFSLTLLRTSIKGLRKAESTSRESAEKVRAIFESINDGIIITDPDGMITDLNQAAANLHQYNNREELIGTNALKLIAKQDRHAARENLQLTLENKNSGFLEYTLVQKNGQEFIGELNAVLLMDRAGNPAGYVALTRDITQRKKAREEHEALIVDLQNKNIQAETIHEITTIVASTLDQTEAVRRILEQLKYVVRYDSASVWLYKEELAEMVGWVNLSSEAVGRGYYTISKKEPDYPLIVDENLDYILLDDIQEKYPQFREASRNNIHSWMAIPLRVHGKLIGFIALDGYKPGLFTDADAQLALTFASQVSIALENARLVSDLKKELAERKQAEQALKLSEEKFYKAFNTTPVLMTIEDDKNVFIDANEAFLATFGLKREEAIGHKASDLNIMYDPDDLMALREKYQEKGFLKDFETRMRRKSGETGVVLLSSDSFYMDGIEHTVTSGLDITERKRAEEKYRSIYNNSIEGIFQSTEDGRFLSVNPAMARIYGYDSPKDMLNRVNDISTQIYVNTEQRKDVRQRLADGERLVRYESLEYRKDGSTFWSSMTAQAIRDENGQILYYEGMVEDITPRKQAEAEREKLITELQSKNEELERFTYTVSHDLKSPLVTINGFLGYLEEDALTGNIERLKKDVQRIQNAVHKMQRLLNELLELSRIGRMVNTSQTISFNELVDEAMDLVRGRIKERGIIVQTQPNLPTVYGDPQRLIEVLQNLIDNAAKYMGNQSDPQIEIGQHGEEDGKPVFFVKDNGIGIEPRFQERIFGLFNKLDANSEGTGVGLALTKRIVEFHGGRIWVESKGKGKGTNFFFTLPVVPAENENS